ncbi:MAG: hypothetical protein RLZZ352_2871 [Pseudomonadota bacterium]|jgi:hypothetical protein
MSRANPSVNRTLRIKPRSAPELQRYPLHLTPKRRIPMKSNPVGGFEIYVQDMPRASRGVGENGRLPFGWQYFGLFLV